MLQQNLGMTALAGLHQERALHEFLAGLFRERGIENYRETGIAQVLAPFFMHLSNGKYALARATPKLIEDLRYAVQLNRLLPKAANINCHSFASLPAPRAFLLDNHDEQAFCPETLIYMNDKSVEEQLIARLDDKLVDLINDKADELLMNDITDLIASTIDCDLSNHYAATLTALVHVVIYAELLEDAAVSKRYRKLLALSAEAFPLGESMSTEFRAEAGGAVHFLTA